MSKSAIASYTKIAGFVRLMCVVVSSQVTLGFSIFHLDVNTLAHPAAGCTNKFF